LRRGGDDGAEDDANDDVVVDGADVEDDANVEDEVEDEGGNEEDVGCVESRAMVSMKPGTGSSMRGRMEGRRL
jgi:hypothetical protein